MFDILNSRKITCSEKVFVASVDFIKKFKKKQLNLLTFSLISAIMLHIFGGVAKLVIALACHAGDRGFEPRRSRFFSLSALEIGSFFYGQ